MNLRPILNCIAIIFIIFSILPFVPLDYWWIRSFDFPHLQLTILTSILLVVYLMTMNWKILSSYIFILFIVFCIGFQFSKIYPYTCLSTYEVLRSKKLEAQNRLAIYTANVYQKNKESIALFRSIENRAPDVLLFTETNKRWRSILSKKFDANYSYKIEAPFENTYGMMLFSKYKLTDGKVRFLVEDTIPSIHSKIILPENDTIQLFAIHPAPPTPHHNPSSVDRDAEMMKIANLAKNSTLPVIIMGDFNDVAWSETTELFQEYSGLLDMRKGRGLFNTYNANNPFLRWPLDHIFVSAHFRVHTVEKGKYIGSDHFPFFVELSYEPELAHRQQLDSPTKKEKEGAIDQIQKEENQE